MSTYVEVRDEDGSQVGASVKAEATSEGEIKVTVVERGEYDFKRPIYFDPSWLEGGDGET